jgi:ferric-dicitrate binding protein FerR (iron transport regulator)
MSDYNEHIDIEALIAKYLSGEASEEEIMLLEAWVRSDDRNKIYFRQSKKAWNLIRDIISDDETEKAWRNIDRKISVEMTGHDKPGITETKPGKQLFYRIAAALFLLITAGVVLYYIVFRQPEVILAATGKVLTETLDDGSSVTLNTNTRLIVTKHFNKEERRVKLSGDAFFDVANDKSKPFIIETGLLNVEVTGTSFYVKALQELQTLEVTVQTGSVVMIDKDNNRIPVSPGEKGIYEKNENIVRKEVNNDPNFMAWKTKQLVFTNQSIEVVVQKIAETYGAVINLSVQDINNCRLTATFDNQPLENVLAIIAETLNLKVETSGNSFILSGTGCE